MTAPERALRHAIVAAETAETEAAILRQELSAAYEHIIRVKLITWQYHESLVPLLNKLHRFNQVNRHEVQSFQACQVEDALTINREIDLFRQRWGRRPLLSDGSPAVVEPYRVKHRNKEVVSRGS